MNLPEPVQRFWGALTTSERVTILASVTLVALLTLVGAVLVAGTPYQAAQTDVTGGDIVDTDGDGLSDAEELLVYGSDVNNPDTSGDTIPDGWAASHMQINPRTGLPSPDPARNTSQEDPSGSGLTNIQEYRLGTDPWKKDTSGDGFHDGWLHRGGLDPTQAYAPNHVCSPDGMTLQEKWDQGLEACKADSSGNGLFDREALDGVAEIGGETFTFEPTDAAAYSTGGSGLADGFAVYYGLDPHDPDVGRIDHSGDGMTANEEARWSIERFDGDVRRALVEGLDLMDPDTSDNGIPDAWLIRHGLDPLDPSIADEDPSGSGLTNLEEYQWGTDPNLADTSGNGLLDGEEVEGWTIVVDGQERRVSSNPLLVDSSGDGMTDYEAKHGEIEIDGETITFPPVDPMLPDTSGDGLTDYATLTLTFGPNEDRFNVTESDTAKNGIPDGFEFAYWTMRQEAVETGEWPAPEDIDPPPGVDQRLFERFQETYGEFPEHAGWPEHLQAPPNPEGECYEEALTAIETRDASALGPGGDLSGDCIPNALSPTAAHYVPSPDLPPGTDPLLDGDQLAPPERGGRTLPPTDPALRSTSGDALLDAWEIRWARHTTDTDGQPAWIPDPRLVDSSADGIPDEEDSWPGKIPGTPACWEDIAYAGDEHREATGAGVPWGASYTNMDEMTRGTHPIGPRACDTSGDLLVDGWKAAHDFNPLNRLERTSPQALDNAAIATTCYPTDHPDLPSPSNLDAVLVDALPRSTSEITADMLPPEDLDEASGLLREEGSGCSWEGGHAVPLTDAGCAECARIGIVVPLDWQQWHKTNPRSDDTSNDGAPDAWKILWYRVALQAGLSDEIRPHEHEPTGPSGADMQDLYADGCSPIVASTLGTDVLDNEVDNCLLGGDDATCRDGVGDHLCDLTCDDGDPRGTFRTDPQGAQRLRDLHIVEVDRDPRTGEHLFLCQPREDPLAQDTDANDNGIDDAVELVHAYRANPDERPQLFSARDDESGNGLSTRSELLLGQPADWPSEIVWWFGSHPYSDTGFDADGDALAEALHLDPDPFENLPEEPTPENAWRIACEAGIVCHDASAEAFDWAPRAGDTNIEVTLTDVGSPGVGGGDRVVTKGQHLDATVDVTSDGTPAEGMPVAFLALTEEETSRLEDGDMSVLANAPRAVCIGVTDAQGSLTTDDCPLESTSTSADLSTTDRTWLGTTTPTWERAFSVLDPTTSHTREGTPATQDRIVAWAMGTGADVGDTDQQPVLVETDTHLDIVDLPETVTSGTKVPVTVRLVDGAGDALNAGDLTLTLAGETYTTTLDEGTGPEVTFDEIQVPRVDDALDLTLEASYEHTPASYISQSHAAETTRVLPTPQVSIVPPRKAIAGLPAAAEVTVHDDGTPVQGPINVTLGEASATETTGSDGTALVRLDIPRDVVPRTESLIVTFEGTGSYGDITVTQDVRVQQRFNATVNPQAVTLAEEQAFAIRLVDLAGRAPSLDVNVTATLGDATRTVELPERNDLAIVSLPINAGLGPSNMTITARTDEDRRYEPLDASEPVTVLSDGHVTLSTDTTPPRTIPRGTTTTATATVTDDIDRPVPEGTLRIEWPYGQRTASITDGQATFTLFTPAHADPEPMRIEWALQAPGIPDASGTEQIGLLIETTLEANATLDPLAGTVTVPLRLTDDQGAPVPGQPLRVGWSLGEGVQAETGSDGTADATLVIPEDVEAGDHALTVRFPGDGTYADAETTVTVPVRAPVTFQAPGDVVWNEGQSLEISGNVQSAASNERVTVPVQARHGEATLATATPGETFHLSIDADTVEEISGGQTQFTLDLFTPGNDAWAPAEATVLIERQTPVTLATGVNRTDEGALVTIQATTPQGPLANAQLGIGGQGTAATTVHTDGDGQATVRVSDAAGMLVVRYGGDDLHAPSQATVSMAQPVAPTAMDMAWITLAVVAVLLIVDAWIVYRAIQRIRVGRQVETVLKDLEEQLLVGDEVQAAIYRAYLNLRATAEVLGAPEQETETVREFGERFVNELRLDDAPVMGLVGIFEQAWYGVVDPSMRTRAIDELRQLQDHLRDKGLVA